MTLGGPSCLELRLDRHWIYEATRDEMILLRKVSSKLYEKRPPLCQLFTPLKYPHIVQLRKWHRPQHFEHLSSLMAQAQSQLVMPSHLQPSHMQ